MFLNAGSPVRSCTPTIKRSNKFLTKHEFIDENESKHSQLCVNVEHRRTQNKDQSVFNSAASENTKTFSFNFYMEHRNYNFLREDVRHFVHRMAYPLFKISIV